MFNKVGSPQPIEIATELCQMCNKAKPEFVINGQRLCSTCKNELENSNKKEENVKQ